MLEAGVEGAVVLFADEAAMPGFARLHVAGGYGVFQVSGSRTAWTTSWIAATTS